MVTLTRITNILHSLFFSSVLVFNLFSKEHRKQPTKFQPIYFLHSTPLDGCQTLHFYENLMATQFYAGAMRLNYTPPSRCTWKSRQNDETEGWRCLKNGWKGEVSFSEQHPPCSRFLTHGWQTLIRKFPTFGINFSFLEVGIFLFLVFFPPSHRMRAEGIELKLYKV